MKRRSNVSSAELKKQVSEQQHFFHQPTIEEVNALLPLVRDACIVLFSEHPSANLAQYKAAVWAALSTFITTLLNKGTYQQGEHTALQVARSIPATAIFAKLKSSNVTNPVLKELTKMDASKYFMRDFIFRSLDNEIPEAIKKSIADEVAGAMNIYSTIHPDQFFDKDDDEDDELHGRGMFDGSSDSSKLFNTSWLDDNEDLDNLYGGGGLMDKIGEIFGTASTDWDSSKNGDPKSFLESLGFNTEGSDFSAQSRALVSRNAAYMYDRLNQLADFYDLGLNSTDPRMKAALVDLPEDAATNPLGFSFVKSKSGDTWVPPFPATTHDFQSRKPAVINPKALAVQPTDTNVFAYLKRFIPTASNAYVFRNNPRFDAEHYHVSVMPQYNLANNKEAAAYYTHNPKFASFLNWRKKISSLTDFLKLDSDKREALQRAFLHTPASKLLNFTISKNRHEAESLYEQSEHFRHFLRDNYGITNLAKLLKQSEEKMKDIEEKYYYSEAPSLQHDVRSGGVSGEYHTGFRVLGPLQDPRDVIYDPKPTKTYANMTVGDLLNPFASRTLDAEDVRLRQKEAAKKMDEYVNQGWDPDVPYVSRTKVSKEPLPGFKPKEGQYIMGLDLPKSEMDKIKAYIPQALRNRGAPWYRKDGQFSLPKFMKMLRDRKLIPHAVYMNQAKWNEVLGKFGVNDLNQVLGDIHDKQGNPLTLHMGADPVTTVFAPFSKDLTDANDYHNLQLSEGLANKAYDAYAKRNLAQEDLDKMWFWQRWWTQSDKSRELEKAISKLDKDAVRYGVSSMAKLKEVQRLKNYDSQYGNKIFDILSNADAISAGNPGVLKSIKKWGKDQLEWFSGLSPATQSVILGATGATVQLLAPWVKDFSKFAYNALKDKHTERRQFIKNTPDEQLNAWQRFRKHIYNLSDRITTPVTEAFEKYWPSDKAEMEKRMEKLASVVNESAKGISKDLLDYYAQKDNYNHQLAQYHLAQQQKNKEIQRRNELKKEEVKKEKYLAERQNEIDQSRYMNAEEFHQLMIEYNQEIKTIANTNLRNKEEFNKIREQLKLKNLSSHQVSNMIGTALTGVFSCAGAIAGAKVGAALGSVGGPIGAAFGAAVGGGISLAVDWLTRSTSNLKEAESYIKQAQECERAALLSRMPDGSEMTDTYKKELEARADEFRNEAIRLTKDGTDAYTNYEKAIKHQAAEAAQTANMSQKQNDAFWKNIATSAQVGKTLVNTGVNMYNQYQDKQYYEQLAANQMPNTITTDRIAPMLAPTKYVPGYVPEEITKANDPRLELTLPEHLDEPKAPVFMPKNLVKAMVDDIPADFQKINKKYEDEKKKKEEEWKKKMEKEPDPFDFSSLRDAMGDNYPTIQSVSAGTRGTAVPLRTSVLPLQQNGLKPTSIGVVPMKSSKFIPQQRLQLNQPGISFDDDRLAQPSVVKTTTTKRRRKTKVTTKHKKKK